MRALGPRGLRSHGRFTRGADGMPPTHQSEALLQVRLPAETEGDHQRLHQARGWEAKTAQRAEAGFAGACGSRAGVPRWGVDGSDRGSLRGRRTARGPTAGRPARSHAQAGRRAALDAPPERHGRSLRTKQEASPQNTRRARNPWRAEDGNLVRTDYWMTALIGISIDLRSGSLVAIVSVAFCAPLGTPAFMLTATW